VINLLAEEIEAIQALPPSSKKRLGFHADEELEP
jgi:hypothetical protein